MSYLPITDHGLIGDLHTAGLVALDGRLVWLAWPRFDSPGLFAAILDHTRGGEWALAPQGSYASAQHYEGESAILVTSFESETGRGELCDWMSPWEGETSEHDLFRVLRCTEGTLTIVGRFAPRPDYARARPQLVAIPGGISFSAHGEQIELASSHTWRLNGSEATLQVTLQAGEELRCVLCSGCVASLKEFERELELTRTFWANWIERCCYHGPWEAMVRRSAITLKLLTYAPSGAIIAAPTTSLPEWIGGERNWDYRYTWLRDASFTLDALYRLGYRDEAIAFFQWLGEQGRRHGTPLQIMYAVDGAATLTEEELPHLEGYRNSRPVRIGNDAYHQRQLDVYGGVLDAAYLYEQAGNLLELWQWEVLRNEIDFVCDHWHELDQGIWEVRAPAAAFGFSRLMCWVALDRGIKLAEQHGWEYNRARWTEVRATIHNDLTSHGWSDSVHAFTQRYGADDLDASMLVLPLVGFLPADDPRVRSTIEQIDHELGAGALIYRYHADDGLSSGEGAFLLCSFWMVDALIAIGELEEARRRFEQLLSYAGPLGLLSEEVDPASGCALGNYPQAFSHIGLINSACRLAAALAGASSR
jgi:GH15 family glucan-1,4-alpha-glucosidase